MGIYSLQLSDTMHNDLFNEIIAERCLPWFCSVANNNRNDDDDSDLVIREMINYILKFNIFRNCKVEWRSYLLFLLSFGAIKNN